MISATEVHARFVGTDHVWRQWRTQPTGAARRPILFLDRDGVMVDEVNYLHRIEDIHFIEGAAETVATFKRAGWAVVIVTNQAGIGRGYYGWGEFGAVNDFILRWLDSRGAAVDAVLAVPHHPDGVDDYRHPSHPMRKPNPGMLLDVAEVLNGDLSRSMIVGDHATDLLAGQRAGLYRGFAVLTGHGKKHRLESEALSSPQFSVQVIRDIGDEVLLSVLESSVVMEGVA